jgi:hypothetical protein
VRAIERDAAETEDAGARYSAEINSDKESDLQTALDMLQSDSTNSEVFRETGLVVNNGGDIRDGFDGEIIGKWSGANDTQRRDSNNKLSRSDTQRSRANGQGVRRGTGVERTADSVLNKPTLQWETLSSAKTFAFGEAVRKLKDKLPCDSEARAYVKLFGENANIEIAREFYNDFAIDPIVAENKWKILGRRLSIARPTSCVLRVQSLPHRGGCHEVTGGGRIKIAMGSPSAVCGRHPLSERGQGLDESCGARVGAIINRPPLFALNDTKTQTPLRRIDQKSLVLFKKFCLTSAFIAVILC